MLAAWPLTDELTLSAPHCATEHYAAIADVGPVRRAGHNDIAGRLDREVGLFVPVAAVLLRAGWLNGTITVMVSGNQCAPPECWGDPQTVCRYLIGAPKPWRVSLAGKP